MTPENVRPTVEGLMGEYTKTLGLGWPVKYRYDARAETAMITTTRGRHDLVFPPTYSNNPMFFACDIAHELTHASMAESIDILFATSYFSAKFDEDTPENNRLIQLLGWTQRFIDVWVADEMESRIDRKLIVADVESFLVAGDQLKVADGTIWAINRACSERLKISSHKKLSEQAYVQVRKVEGKEMARKYFQLAEMLSTLPRLSYNLKLDLAALHTMTNETSKILGLGITASIVHEDGMNVWTVG